MPTVKELVAHGRNEDDICKTIGADWLVFQDIEDLEEAVRVGSGKVQEFDSSVFTGHYVTEDVSQEYLEQLESARNDTAKKVKGAWEAEIIELHNSA